MDQDLSGSDLHTSQDSDNDQSLVGKLKKNVSEIISNTPLSKWFRKTTPTSSVRRRQGDTDDEDDLQELQPPPKRTKLPLTKEALSLDVSAALSPISSANNASKPVYRRFPEPVAGPSGCQTRKLINSTSILPERSHLVPRLPMAQEASSSRANKEANSDSEESTSGYSSGRVGSKELMSQEGSKQASPSEASPRKSRSLFETSSASRLLAPDGPASSPKNSSLSSRMPSFNPSMFGSSSFADRTLSSKRLLNSPFYNGRTIYGGASAYGRSTKRCPQDIQHILRQSVRIKPSNAGINERNMQLGKTARRILDTLEKYSSPVSDAKQIPVATKKGSLANFIGANPYRIREPRGPSNRELQVPSVTDLLKSKIEQQKSRLQSTTESVRQIATNSTNVLSTEAYQIPVQKDNEKRVSKMKTKITSVRQKVQVDETVPELNLQPVSLPIEKLPTFDFIVPPPVQRPAKATPKEDNKHKAAQENGKISGAFKFSSPIILADCLKPLKSINHFKFSEPLVKKRRSIHAELDEPDTKPDDCNKSRKNNGENVPEIAKADNLWEKFKPKNNMWECSVCMIRNQSEALKCVACETPNSQKKQSTEAPKPFAPLVALKVPDATWECPTCLVRNKADILKCLACTEKRPEKTEPANLDRKLSSEIVGLKGPPPALGGISAFSTMPLTSPAKTAEIGCGFGDDFKKKTNEWECQVCMVRNNADSSKCQCCESGNPSMAAAEGLTKGNSGISSFSFGIDKNTANSFTFGVPPEEASASRPKTNAALVFGEKREEPKEEQSFTFGVPANEATKASPEAIAAPNSSKVAEEPSKPATFSLGLKPAESAASKAPAFSFAPASKSEILNKSPSSQTKAEEASPISFGAPKGEEEAAEKASAKPQPATPSFSFGSSSKTDPKLPDKGQETKVNPLLKPNEKLPEKSAVAPAGFTFGLPKVLPTPVSPATSSALSPQKRARSDEAESTPLAKSAMFSFKSPTTNGEVGKSLFGNPAQDKPAAPGGFSFNFASNPAPAATSAIVAPTFASTVSKSSPKQAAPVFKFGASASEATKQANGFSFGSAAPAKPAETKPFTFGQSPASSFAPTPPKQGQFSFGSGTEPKPATFSFSAPSTETKPFAPSFAAAPPTTKPTFGFGAPAAPTFSFGGFNQKTESTFAPSGSAPATMFGATGSQTFGAAAVQQPASFGAAPAQSSLNGSFNFGAAAAGTQKAGFTFGASSTNSESGTPSSGFNFGSSALNATAPSGGFNFVNPTPSFDANAKPSFNFTGGAGLAAFSATPSQDGSSMPPRKMKRGVRRTVR